MPEKTSEAVATGGTRPAATGPGATGGGATGGGQAVPDAETLMGQSGTLGDTGSLDDAGLSSGVRADTSVAEEDGATAQPHIPQSPTGGTDRMAKDSATEEADVPTGGLTSSV